MNTAARLVLMAALALTSGASLAAEAVEGKDYFRVNPAVPTSDASKIVVTEYFSYQCPHCFTFAKPFAAWSARLPEDVKADRAAVSIGHASWVAAGRAFYALTAMKAVPAIDDAFFGAIHRERKNLAEAEAIAAWVAGQGIDRAAFGKAYDSFSVQLQARRAEEFVAAATSFLLPGQATATPAPIIRRTTSPSPTRCPCSPRYVARTMGGRGTRLAASSTARTLAAAISGISMSVTSTPSNAASPAASSPTSSDESWPRA